MPAFGFLPSPKDHRDFNLDPLLRVSADQLPDKYLCDNMPAVLNQGETPACVAYATSAMKSWQEYREDSIWLDFDEDHFYKICKQRDGKPNTEGTYMRIALGAIRFSGYPLTIGGVRRIAAYFKLSTDIVTMRRAIFEFGPLAIGMMWAEEWLKTTRSGVLPTPRRILGGHAVLMYGWSGYGFICRNSWGEDWGVNGSFILPYQYLHYVQEAWKTIDQISPNYPDNWHSRT